MIICRTPLRISLLGGGTDIPAYYEEFGGEIISLAIKKYTYITIHPKYGEGFRISYSKTENVSRVVDIEHTLIRNTLVKSQQTFPLEITSIAEVPSKGTGLGSSSSFTVGLLNALTHFSNSPMSRSDLAESAWRIESQSTSSGIGKQDQYAVVNGGLNRFEFCQNGEVRLKNFGLSADFQATLLNSLFIVDTGISRLAGTILASQLKDLISSNRSISARHTIKAFVERGAVALQQNDLESFAGIISETWNQKKLFGNVSNDEIDQIYQYGLTHGAIGGKLLGAGGGGFFLFIVPQSCRLHFLESMSRVKLHVLSVELDTEGTSIVYRS